MVKLSCRLNAAANFVREGKRLADIGCDHGYVPVSLVLSGKIKFAVASDINEGPLDSCRRLVKKYRLENKIKCVLSDGLENISLDDVDDILIAGVGGILIYEILDNCDFEKLKEKHIILNPMTHPEDARRWLYDNGFEIDNDIIIKDGKHYYNVLDAYYKNKSNSYCPADYYLGNIRDFSNKEYFVHLLNYLKNKQKGKFELNDIISAVEEIINDNR